MTGAKMLEAALDPTTRLLGPLAGQRPRRMGTLAADPWLSAAVAALLAIGVVMVLNVSYFHAQQSVGDPLFFFRKHVASIGLGLLGAYVAARLSSDAYRRLAYPAVILALGTLAAVLVPGLGAERGGAQRWIVIGSTSFQPSEMAKLALVLYLAASLARKQARIAILTTGVFPHCIVGGCMAAMLLREPDFGSAALCVGIVAIMLFVGGARPQHLLGLAGVTLPLLVLGLLLSDYRIERIITFLYPMADPLGAGFQLNQSLIAFGSGGVTGAGLGKGQQKMFFLPAAHTDFIYSVVGEELGLLGGLLILGLFGCVAVRGMRIAARHPDAFGTLLATGVTLLIVVQALLNIGVVLGCLPTKGLVLPFISYGGSAMLLTLAEVGILLALARESR